MSTRAASLSGVQDSKRTSDAVATTAAVVIFWPAAFLVSGGKQTAAELALMKGQMVAIEQASVQKNCGIQFFSGHQRAEPVRDFLELAIIDNRAAP